VGISYNDTLILLQAVTGGQYAWGFWFFDPDYTPLIWQSRLLLSGVMRYITGHTLLPEFSTLESTGHLGTPIDQINCWFVHLSPDDLVGQIVVLGLVIVLICVTYQIAMWFIRQRSHVNERPLPHQEDCNASIAES